MDTNLKQVPGVTSTRCNEGNADGQQKSKEFASTNEMSMWFVVREVAKKHQPFIALDHAHARADINEAKSHNFITLLPGATSCASSNVATNIAKMHPICTI